MRERLEVRGRPGDGSGTEEVLREIPLRVIAVESVQFTSQAIAVGHRTSLRQQLERQAIDLKAALDSPVSEKDPPPKGTEDATGSR